MLIKADRSVFMPQEKIFDFVLIIPVLVTLYLNISDNLLFTVLLHIGFFSVSIGLSLSVFNFGNLFFQSRIYYLIFISSLICLFLVQASSDNKILSGQNAKYIVRITGRVSTDSKEISGGYKVFDIHLISTQDMNSTITSASGNISIASKIDVYAGQFISLTEKNILVQDSKIIFIDRKNIRILGWNTIRNTGIKERKARLLMALKPRISRMGASPGSLFTALFVGVKENPKGELFTALRRSGGSHILALSGMHLGIISFGIMLAFTGLFGKKISFALTLFIIVFYVFIVDAGPSLSRALILFIILGLLGFSGNKTDIFHILSICFLIQLLLEAKSAYMLSFQLSYLSLTGIILGSRKIDSILPYFIPVGVRGVLSASISAQLFTAPLVLYHFGVIYPVGIISGIILVPVITLFIWTGIIGLLPMPLILQKMIFSIVSFLYKIIEVSSNIFSQFPLMEFRSVLWFALFLLIVYLIHFFYKILNK